MKRLLILLAFSCGTDVRPSEPPCVTPGTWKALVSRGAITPGCDWIPIHAIASLDFDAAGVVVPEKARPWVQAKTRGCDIEVSGMAVGDCRFERRDWGYWGECSGSALGCTTSAQVLLVKP